jgi:hypothetical protein
MVVGLNDGNARIILYTKKVWRRGWYAAHYKHVDAFLKEKQVVQKTTFSSWSGNLTFISRKYTEKYKYDNIRRQL